ncbi:inactive hydroxysteroid dehydrogenase-like protein 1 [Trichomycterus rosablanca]|uniref:inactive hydroxysteroid dehydrogenase-like protein 1 n=1 Tax=Trichomycterus rosablanca TaxID=2290929 RepID=UPI002F354F7C
MAAVDSFPLLYREIARSCGCYMETLALVGAVYTAGTAVCLMHDCYRLIRLHFIPRLMSSGDLVHRYGRWAIISGASEDIAKAYAEELARHGVSLILVSRDVSSVRDSAASISEAHGVETISVEADFSLGPAACTSIVNAVADKDVGFVVNCLSSHLHVSQSFHRLSESELWHVINDSVSAASLITRLALPGMVERRRGAVVNISSGRCCRSSEGTVVLSAATAFLDHFSRALRYEYAPQGVFVQSLVPYRVAPRDPEGGFMTSWFVPEPRVYARHALSTLGVSHRTTGYWPHTLQLRLVRCVPEWIRLLGSRLMFRTV